MRKRHSQHALTGIAAALSLLLGLGCTGMSFRPGYDYFAQPDPRDAWSKKIRGWQQREVVDENGLLSISDPEPLPIVVGRPGFQPAVSGPERAPDRAEAVAPAVATSSGLRSKYFAFRAERKRHTARQLADWIQGQAKQHYVADGPIDHWATLEETLRDNGDDCDGLELLVYHALRDLGFAETEVFRAIVYRPSDSQHHMVTLWFEDPDDPWVIDPTGAMTHAMMRMSAMPEWVPLKVFSETSEFTVRHTASAADLASSP